MDATQAIIQQHTAPSLQNMLSDAAVPNIPWLPDSPQKPDDWFQWSEDILMHRMQIMAETTHGMGLTPAEVEANRDREAERFRKSKMYGITTYGSIYEARPDEDADEGDVPPGFMIPFIPYPFQIRLGYEYDDILHTRGGMGDSLWIKSRDMGLSNFACFLVASDWMIKPIFQARLLSRVESLVDATGDPDSLFWKIEQFLAALPNWLFERLVPGFDWRKHRQLMKFIHPRSKNTIQGESTQANAGRGGRATVIIYDEIFFMENLGAIWTAGRASTRHRIGISTVSTDVDMAGYNLAHGLEGYDQPRIIKIPHYENPMHDDAWLAAERERDTEEGIEREIFMNWHAGTGSWVYPETHEIRVGDYPFEPGAGPVYVTMDDGFDDDFAIVWVQYMRRTGKLRVFQAYQNRHMVTDFYGSLLIGVPESNFGSKYGKEERRIMMRQLEEMPPIVYTVDTHFDNVEQMTGSSPYERFANKYNIVAHMSFDKKKRDFKPRRLALGKLLPHMEFNERDGVPEVLEALQRHRFKNAKPGEDQMSEYKKAMQGKHGHLVTALEWLAVNWDEVKFSAGDVTYNWGGKPHNS